MDRLAIAVFEPRPSYGGGSERILLDVARQLALKGHRCFLLYDEAGSMLRSFSEFVEGQERTEVRQFGWRTWQSSFRRARAIADSWRRCKADVVLASDTQFIRLLALAGLISGTPMVLHLGVDNWRPGLSQRLAMKRFAAGVAPSAHTAHAWQRAGWPTATLHQVPNGVDTKRFAPATERSTARSRLNLPLGDPVIVYVGRLVREKGISTLLKAVARIRRLGMAASLVVVGPDSDGAIARFRAEAVATGLESADVCFTGAKDNPEEYLAAADVAVVPSEWEEPFGLAVLEAMACGTPPVVSDRGVMSKLVVPFRNQLVFQAGDDAQLATRLLSLLSSPHEREVIGATLRESAECSYSVEKMSEEYERIVLASASVRSRRSKR